MATHFPTLLCTNTSSIPSLPLSSSTHLQKFQPLKPHFKISPNGAPNKHFFSNQRFKIPSAFGNSSKGSKSTRQRRTGVIQDEEEEDDDDVKRGLVRSGLWGLEGVYILWLFLLPYAPGDPVWAISSDTINSLVGLSLNFFFILPLSNAVGIHLLEAPVLHPMSEGLFNFVVSWTVLFGPLLYTDLKRDRFKGSMDILWGFMLFLTNTFMIPYMAIRLNEADEGRYPTKPSQLGTAMINGAPTAGLIGGAVCLISIIWALFGRMDGDFGSVSDRWEYLLNYLGSERLAYAFIWDIVLYSIFQPWLIGANLANVQENRVDVVKYLRYIPVVGLVAYLLFMNREELYMEEAE